MEYARIPLVPLEVRLFLPYGWLVGGGARFMTDHTIPIDKLPRDWDIIVPLANWQRVSRLIPPGTPANTFGGFKITHDKTVIDIWASEVGDYFLTVDDPAKNAIALNYDKKMTVRATNFTLNNDGQPCKPKS